MIRDRLAEEYWRLFTEGNDELEGVVSRMGVPYAITGDWMQPVMEDGDEGRIDRCRRT